MMNWSPGCFIPSFVQIDPPVPEKNIFEGFLPYMGEVVILAMRTASCHQNFIALYLKVFLQNLVQIGTIVSEKIQFEFLYVHDIGRRTLGKGQEMTLTFNTYIFIYSIRCLLLLPFRSLAAIVSEKIHCFHFFL